MNIPTLTPNLIKSLNFLIRAIGKFRTPFFNCCISILRKKDQNLLANRQIHNHYTWSSNQLSIVRANRSDTQHCVHHGTITRNSIPDVSKVKLLFFDIKKMYGIIIYQSIRIYCSPYSSLL